MIYEKRWLWLFIIIFAIAVIFMMEGCELI